MPTTASPTPTPISPVAPTAVGEALAEAERYPEDFDGIVAGAPANHWTHHFTGFLWNEQALNANPASKIPAAKLPAIQKAALAQCDTLDGVKDNLIEDPRACHFNPSVLLCKGADDNTCLTQPQIDALEKIYAGPKDPQTGAQIYPGYEPGTEADPAAWAPWIIGPLQPAFANSFFSEAVHEDPHWDWRTAGIAAELHLADEKTAAIINSGNPDLRTFRDHGGKLIQYHGWGDAAIAPRDSIAFYEQVRTFLATYPDPRATNPKQIESFYRLFMVPGMQHCAGGQGPTSFGNDDNPKRNDPDHDVVLALDRWVTQGIAPQKLIGTWQRKRRASHASPLRLPRSRPLQRPRRSQLRRKFHLSVARTSTSSDTLFQILSTPPNFSTPCTEYNAGARTQMVEGEI